MRSRRAWPMHDALTEKGLSVLSVRRISTTFKAVIYMREAESKKRVSMPVETISQIQRSCIEHDDNMRWLIALKHQYNTHGLCSGGCGQKNQPKDKGEKDVQDCLYRTSSEARTC